jgi:hypothetical protein
MEQNQTEILNLINQYNSTDRGVIKANLKRLMVENNITPREIISLGYTKNNVYAWTNQAANNIPLFEQALNIATSFNFNVKEFLKEM